MQNMKNKENGVIGGLFWSFAERISAQLVSAIVTIVLARLLDPEHYGIVAIVTVFISILNVFVTSGPGSALVQKKEADEIDFNTAFIIGESVSVVLYILLFFVAPFIADFYGMDELTALLRVMGVRLLIADVNSIQHAYIRRKMEFKRFFWATFFGTVLSGVVGICLAYLGYGVWALAAQYLTNVFVDTIMLFIIGGWIPKFQFSIKKAKEIWTFGWKVLASHLVSTVESSARSLLIGKVFSSEDLAFYNQGEKYPGLLINNVNSSIARVMLPVYSKKQDDIESLVLSLRNSIRMAVYLLAPMLIGLAAVSNNFVSIVLTDKWLSAVPFMQIFCFGLLMNPLSTACQQALLAICKSDTMLVCTIFSNCVSFAGILIAAFALKSAMWIALISLVTTVLSLIVVLSCANRYLHYKFKQQMADIFPSLIVALAMGAMVYTISFIDLKPILCMLIQIIAGVALYLLMSALFKLEQYTNLKRFLAKYIRVKN